MGPEREMEEKKSKTSKKYIWNNCIHLKLMVIENIIQNSRCFYKSNENYK